MNNLRRKVLRLEEKLNVKAIPHEARRQIVQGSGEQRKVEIKRRQAELVEKYGAQALEEIVFVEIIDRFPDDEAQV